MNLKMIVKMLFMLFTVAALFAGGSVSAQEASGREAPKLFADLSSSTRVYPNANAALTGFALGSSYKPTEKCLHIAGELFARFGRKDGTPEDLKMRTAGAAVGALWGTGDWDHWFGAGAMFDLGWGRVGSQDQFVSSAYLRALLLWRSTRGVLGQPRPAHRVCDCAHHRRRRGNQGPLDRPWDRRVLGQGRRRIRPRTGSHPLAGGEGVWLVPVRSEN